MRGKGGDAVSRTPVLIADADRLAGDDAVMMRTLAVETADKQVIEDVSV